MKTKFKLISWLLVNFYILTFTFVLAFQRNWFSELCMSFLPFALVLNFLIFAGKSYLFFKKQKYKKNSFTFFVDFLLIITTLYATTLIISFNFLGNVTPNVPTNAITLKIAFFNKLAPNEQFDEIGERVKQLDPDIIGFAEFDKEADKKVGYLHTYPYSYIPDWHSYFKGDGVAIYSKYPLNDMQFFKLDISPTLYTKVEINSKTYNLFVMHTTAPIYPSYLEYRTKQMDFLAEHINELGNNTIVMGDFNLAPWSVYYNDFYKKVGNKIIDTAKGQGLKFTWTMFGIPDFINLPILMSEIDHIFVPINTEVKSFNVDEHMGSDHKLIWVEVRL
jgi:endonuclease/exonuclease/phosphatase (EEP) superfamily protein YafD